MQHEMNIIYRPASGHRNILLFLATWPDASSSVIDEDKQQKSADSISIVQVRHSPQAHHSQNIIFV